jgi:hypothetical protein
VLLADKLVHLSKSAVVNGRQITSSQTSSSYRQSSSSPQQLSRLLSALPLASFVSLSLNSPLLSLHLLLSLQCSTSSSVDLFDLFLGLLLRSRTSICKTLGARKAEESSEIEDKDAIEDKLPAYSGVCCLCASIGQGKGDKLARTELSTGYFWCPIQLKSS